MEVLKKKKGSNNKLANGEIVISQEAFFPPSPLLFLSWVLSTERYDTDPMHWCSCFV